MGIHQLGNESHENVIYMWHKKVRANETLQIQRLAVEPKGGCCSLSQGLRRAEFCCSRDKPSLEKENKKKMGP